MWDSKTSRFIKKVRITEEQNKYLERIKGKKSKAGKLEEIIKEYEQCRIEKDLSTDIQAV